jgi:drug/metabolite transporter (DMT)-like permease
MVAQVWPDTGLDPIGVMAGLGAAACVATYFLVGGHTVAARDTGSLTFYMFLFGGVFWAVSQPWWTVDLSMLASTAPLLGALGAYSVPAWAGVVWIVILGTLAPYALNLAALRRISPTAVGVIGMSEPVGAGLVAWAWLGQALTTIQVAGGLIVLVGIGLVQRAAVPGPVEPATAVQMRGKMGPEVDHHGEEEQHLESTQQGRREAPARASGSIREGTVPPAGGARDDAGVGPH